MALKRTKFDVRKVEDILKKENQFISRLFSVLSLPQNIENDEDSNLEASTAKPPLVKAKTSRAKSLVELQSRIEKLKDKNKTYKEKLQKKKLKNRLKKKIKQEKRNATQKKPNVKTETEPNNENENNIDMKNKPIFNKKDKMVYSKIDFTGLGKDNHKRRESNPKKILEKVQKVNHKIETLKETGETEKAIEMKEKNIWKNALAKAQGFKVKDDPILLKKSIQKMEQKKRSSKKKWETRIEGVKKAKEEKQKKRMENIEKRKKDKKLNKLKKAANKGKVIPGL